MKLIFSKGSYKVISLFIKATILLLSFLYIYFKLNNTSINSLTEVLLKTSNFTFLVICLILMLVNWGIEALKWKTLIAKIEKISFEKSIKSVFTGITISIFTPNRVGEFAGRIFYLQKSDKITATIISFIGSIAQLIITIVAGILAFFIAAQYSFSFNTIFSTTWIIIIVAVVIFLLLSLLFLYKKRKKLKKLQKHIEVVSSFSKKIIAYIFLLSAIRYIVFSLQYFIVLLIFDINIGLDTSLILISLVFFVSSAIPTFAITEIAVRGATAVYFFSFVSDNTSAIISSSLLLWIINIALPSVIGSFFIWGLKFFKD